VTGLTWTVASVLFACAVWSMSAITAFSNLPLFAGAAIYISIVRLYRPAIAVGLLLFFSFLDLRTNVAGVGIRIYEAVTIASAVTLAVTASRSATGLPQSRGLFAPLWPLVVVCCLSVVYSISPTETITQILRLLVVILFAATASAVYAIEKYARQLDFALGIGLAVAIVMGFLQMLMGPSFLEILRAGAYVPFMSAESLERGHGSFYIGHSGGLRPFSFFATPHMHVAVVAMTALFFLGKRKTAPLLRLVACVALIQVAVSDVYGGLVGLVAAFGLGLVVYLARFGRLVAGLVVIGCAGVAAVLIEVLPQLIDSLSDRGSPVRLLLWESVWSSFLGNQLLGAGYGTIHLLIRDFNAWYGYDFDHAHSWYIQTLGELGFLGGGALLWFLVGMGKRAYAASVGDRGQGVAGAMVLGYFMGHSTVDSFVTGGNVVFALFLALLGCSLVVATGRLSEGVDRRNLVRTTEAARSSREGHQR